MTWFHRLASMLRWVFRRREAERDLDEELRTYVEMAAAAKTRDGVDPSESRRQARLEMGGLDQVNDQVRAKRHGGWLDDVGRDVRYGCRALARNPGFALVIILTLGLGIGVNNTVFTIVNAMLLRGLPFDRPDEIVALQTEDARGETHSVSRLDFYDWRDQTHSFAGLSMFVTANMNVSDEGRVAEQFVGTYGTANMFALIGARPRLGRDFQASDDEPGAEAVVILSYGLWTNRYGSDPRILGRTIHVNTLPCTVIGVMPPDLQFPSNNDLWMPWSKLPLASRTAPRAVRNFTVFGRLAPGVTLAQARADLDIVGARLARDYPSSNKDIRPIVQRFNDAATPPGLQLMLYALWGAVLFVLLIACANAANLLLARAAPRSREVAIRLALGASRWRVVRQLLVESLLLSILSGLFGFGLSIVGVRLLDTVLTTAVGKPSWMTFTMDARVVIVLTMICVATGLLFGAAPALHLAKTDLHEVLKATGGRSNTGGLRMRRWAGALITAEVVLTLVLLAGAGFMMQSFLALYRMDVGVETSHVLTMELILPLTKYPQTAPRAALYRRLEERLHGVREIQASALTTTPPLYGGFTRELAVEGRLRPDPGKGPEVTMVGVGTRYFDTVGAALIRGRGLSDLDGMAGHIGVVVNQRFIEMQFPTEDPLGRQITLTDPTPQVQQSAPTVATIVGVVRNIRQSTDPVQSPVVYVPYQADPQRIMFLLMRTAGDPGRVTSVVRNEMRTLEPEVPLFNVATLDEVLARPRWPFRVYGSMFAIFAAIALVLSAVGLYAVTAYSVTQRTPEIGLRVALGARPVQVVWLVLRRAMAQLAIAVPIGVAGAFGVGRLLQSLLVQTSGRDPLTIVAITALMVVIALVACLVPAQRAMRLDPLTALRDE